MAAPKGKFIEKEVSDTEEVSSLKPEVVKSEKNGAIDLIKEILVLSLSKDDGLTKTQRKEKSEKLLILVEKLKAV